MNYDRLLFSLLISLLGAETLASAAPGWALRAEVLAAVLLWGACAGSFTGRRFRHRVLAIAVHSAVYLGALEATALCFPEGRVQRVLFEQAVYEGRSSAHVIRDSFNFTIISHPERPAAGKIRFRARLGGTNAEILLEGADLPWSELSQAAEGDSGVGTIRLKLITNAPEAPPPVFSYSAYLYRRGIIATGKLEILDSFGSAGPSERAEFLERIVGSFGSTPELAVILASTLAEEDFLDEATKRLFRNTGLTHVLVVSGYQVGVLFVLIFAFSRAVIRRFELLLVLVPLDALAAAASFAGACFYAGLTGGPLTAVRAVLALALLAVGRAISRRVDLWRSFTAVVLVSFFLWPGACFEAGCQLMFAALLGLIAAERFAGALSKRFELSEKVAGLVAVSILPAVMTTPIVIVWLEIFVPHSFLFNLTFAPVMSMICTTYGGLALSAVWLDIPGAGFVFRTALWLTKVIVGILAALESLLVRIGVHPVELAGRSFLVGLGASIVVVVVTWVVYFRLELPGRRI